MKCSDSFRDNMLGLTIDQLLGLEDTCHWLRCYIASTRRRLMVLRQQHGSRGEQFQLDMLNKMKYMVFILRNVDARACLDHRDEHSEPPPEQEYREGEGEKLMRHPILKSGRRIIYGTADIAFALLVAGTLSHFFLGIGDSGGLVPRTPVMLAAKILDPKTVRWLVGVAAAALTPLTISGTPGDNRGVVLEVLMKVTAAFLAVRGMKTVVTTFDTSQHGTAANVIVTAILSILGWAMRLVGWAALGWAIGSTGWFIDAFWHQIPLYPTLLICVLVIHSLMAVGSLVMPPPVCHSLLSSCPP
ncbi:hypothetical protein QBC34DRAFT_403125 [Podospora aff. communis PSN243]|uniref:Uncharacterized protein n=1 Tax=Podospora aff. communis PSN243 TaxID=3040156 RepID=A0AAV9GQI8_9PEZI|nr:hypothetical protein QBC34DRAFT_403125 [Podospora aff. communis PSN243]